MRCHKQHDGDCPHTKIVGGMQNKTEDCPIEEEDRDWAKSLLSSLRENGLEPTIYGVVLLAHRARERRQRLAGATPPP